MSSGGNVWSIRGKAPAGITCWRRWWFIGWWIQAASGGCIGSGLKTARWPIYWRLELTPCFSPVGTSDRGPYFCGFPGLLLARELARAAAGAGAGAHAALNAGEVRGRSNARRAFSNDRWTGTGVLPPHPAGEGPQNVAVAFGVGTAAPVTTKNHPERRNTQRLTWCRPLSIRGRFSAILDVSTTPVAKVGLVQFPLHTSTSFNFSTNFTKPSACAFRRSRMSGLVSQPLASRALFI